MHQNKNEIQLKRTLNDSWTLSGTAGLTLAYCSKKLDKRTTIDLPVVFPRLGVFYNGYGIKIRLGFAGVISPRLGLLTDLNVLLLPGLEEGFGITMETDDIVDFSSFKKGNEILKKYKVQI